MSTEGLRDRKPAVSKGEPNPAEVPTTKGPYNHRWRHPDPRDPQIVWGKIKARNEVVVAQPGIVISEQGREKDKLLDQHHEYEFGGPWGTAFMMVFFPCLMYYLWICLWFYDGKLVYPSGLNDVVPFLKRMGHHIATDAFPTWRAIRDYGGLIVFQLFLAVVMPGYWQEGLPVPSLGYKTLMYKCNALSSLYATLVVTAALHFSGVYQLQTIMYHFGEYMTVAIISGFLYPLILYVSAVVHGTTHRMSGNFFYDYFMGASLNPRFGVVDLKMWAEVRIPWVLLFEIALAGAARQYDEYGYVSPNMAFMILATGLYLNACCKGEELIPQTWDMFYEKAGFLVSYWNLAGVPFTYCYSIVYMSQHDPATYRFSTLGYVALYGTLLFVHWVFDSSMAQKSRFRILLQKGSVTQRFSFPQWPWSTLKEPVYLQTEHGNALLIDGWWAYLRKPNYTADWIQSFTWGACAGTGSLIPYFYAAFFLTVLTHRCGRDFDRCARKYGKDWDKYCQIVPYRFIPFVF